MSTSLIKGTIYAILDDGYFYIGSTTKSIEERIKKHITDSKKNQKKLYKYINDVRKGWDNIIYITLEEIICTKKELHDKEYEYIKKHITDKFCLNTIQDEKQGCIIRNYINRKKKL